MRRNYNGHIGRQLHHMRPQARRDYEPNPTVPRPDTKLLTDVVPKKTRLPLPHGCFNAGLASDGADGYVCVIRPNEYRFSVCRLNKHLTITQPPIDLGVTNAADPRLIWLPDRKLAIFYSSFDDTGYNNECIRGAILWEPELSQKFRTPLLPVRVSPPGITRQKNWMPFLFEDRLHFVASVKPHIVYELPEFGPPARQVYETDWVSCWFNKEFFRGNTNIVPFEDGRYLGTFHTVMRNNAMHYYDNGVYVFDNKPPFKVLRCSSRTYLPAESATEPHYRKRGIIAVCFPCGMVRNPDNELVLSYGDNDSCVKIGQTTVAELLTTTLPVY